MTRAFIGIGSNIDPETHIPAALELLGQEVLLEAVSTFYRTEPLGAPGTGHFYNGAARIETSIEPRELKFGVLGRIEEKLGRVRGPDAYAPRTVDLDLVLYGNRVIGDPDLVVPDPDIFTRAFVAVPVLELAPGLVLPGSGRRLEHIVTSLSTGSMIPLEAFTRRLKERI